MSKDLSRTIRKIDVSKNKFAAPNINLFERPFSKLKKSLNQNPTEESENIVYYSIKDSAQFLMHQWREIITTPFFGANISAGITVAAVALPLNLALAIASGLPPSTGIISGAIGGVFAAIFGGSRFQATGPAAALNAMVFAIVQQFGPVGAAAAALIIGLIQVTLSLFSAGTFVKFVPEAILLGFTSGVGIKLLDSQLPKLFGIDWTMYHVLSHFTNPIWLHEVSWTAVVCGLFVVFFILALKSIPRFPAALISIAVTTQLAVFLDWPILRVGEIPKVSLNLIVPSLSLSSWLQLAQLTLPLGLLAAIESILSAQTVDRMSGDKHNSNLELLGQGIANFASGLVGAMPVSGVIVRSVVNVESGAKNRLASLFHALFLLASALYLSKLISQVPIAALAGLLCIVGFRLIEFKELIALMKHNRAQALGFLATIIGTVSDHIVLGLLLGLALAWFGLRKTINNTNVVKNLQVTKIEQADTQKKPVNSNNVVYSMLDRGEQWLHHLKQQASIPNTSYIHPNASIIGRVIMGRNVHIAAEASVRADEGTPFYIGDGTNVQDGVVIHALKQKWISVQNERWAVYIGRDVSLAHQALIHGPCYIGDDSFIGFKAVIHDSIIGKGCYIGIGAIVVGVEIPDERYVPHGAIIDTEQKAIALIKVSPIHQHFNEDVVEVNKGLVEAYRELGVTNGI